MTHRGIAGLVAAALVAASGLVGLTVSPAAAAQCSDTKGVSVVVDFSRGAGGGLATACDASGGGRGADSNFERTGFHLTYVKGSGFVCKVRNSPDSASCEHTAPANAYWGLFWAKPGATSWTYASSGVGGLNIPAGGAVAWAFQDGGGTDYPGQAPSKRSSPTPKPTPKPAPKPTKKATAKPTKKATSAQSAQSSVKSSATTAPTASQSAASRKASATPSPSASATASASATSSASSSASVAPPTASDSASPEAAGQATQLTSSDPDTGGLPLWVPGAVVVALGAATGGALWWRRRSGA